MNANWSIINLFTNDSGDSSFQSDYNNLDNGYLSDSHSILSDGFEARDFNTKIMKAFGLHDCHNHKRSRNCQKLRFNTEVILNDCLEDSKNLFGNLNSEQVKQKYFQTKSNNKNIFEQKINNRYVIFDKVDENSAIIEKCNCTSWDASLLWNSPTKDSQIIQQYLNSDYDLEFKWDNDDWEIWALNLWSSKNTQKWNWL